MRKGQSRKAVHLPASIASCHQQWRKRPQTVTTSQISSPQGTSGAAECTDLPLIPQASTSYVSQARSSSPSSTTSRSKYKPSSDDEVFREESMPRRCQHVRKTQAKHKQKVKKSAEKARQMPDSDEPVESNDSDRTVIIKTEMSEENNSTRKF